jgi:hypothetical protein
MTGMVLQLLQLLAETQYLYLHPIAFFDMAVKGKVSALQTQKVSCCPIRSPSIY